MSESDSTKDLTYIEKLNLLLVDTVTSRSDWAGRLEAHTGDRS